nr:ribonuclease H-like domain-containing protein [Tanacetum cinerariifolium]
MSLYGYSDGEYDVGGNDDNVTIISKLDVSHRLHLHANDFVALTVVFIKLKGTENYQVWSCAMLLALEVDETYTVSNGLDDTYMQIGSFIFSRETLPDVRSAYAIISSEESHKIAVGSVSETSQRCFKIIRYLADFGKRKAGSNLKGKNVSNNVVGSNLKGKLVFTFRRHLKEIYETWAHLEKKRTRLRTNTKTLQDLKSQSPEMASPFIHDAVTLHLNPNPPPTSNRPVLPAALRAQAVQELYELQRILAFVDSRLKSIERSLNNFANQPTKTIINDLEFDDESVDTPLVSSFPHSNNDSDDDELLNELIKKSVAYFDPFLPMSINTRKAYNTLMVEGLESTRKSLVAVVRDVYVFVGSFTYITDFMINKLPTDVLNGKSPYDLVYNKPHSLKQLRSFGCLAYATILNSHDKFGSKSEKCVLVGYSNSKKGYKLWSLDNKRIMYYRDVKFFENIFPFKQNNSTVIDNSVQYVNHLKNFNTNTLDAYLKYQMMRREGTPALSGMDANASVSENGSFAADEENNSNSEGNGLHDQSQDNVSQDNNGAQNLRMSSRTSVFPKKFNDFIVDSKVKYGLEKYNSWSLFQMDINNAFVYGDLEETVYMNLTPGYFLDNENKVCKLNKSLYGLKQTPRQWNAKLIAALLENNFMHSKSDYSLFTKSFGDVFIALLVYVDDIIITENSLTEIEMVKQFLKTKFMIKDLGKLKYFLGIEVLDTPKGICLNQRKYCLDLIDEFGLLAGKPSNLPMQPNISLTSEPSDTDPLLDNVTEYQKLIGKHIYLTITRPDIAYTVSCLSQFMHNPLRSHLKTVIKVIRYLKGSPCKGINVIKGSASSIDLKAYSDPDWARCADTRRSIIGYGVFMCGSLVSWKSKKQNTIPKFSIEVEYRAIASVTSKIIWILKILKD